MKKKKQNIDVTEISPSVEKEESSEINLEVKDPSSQIKNSKIIEITKPSADDVPFADLINQTRVNITTAVKRSKVRSSISMGVIVVCCIAGLILLSIGGSATNIIAWCLLGLAIAVIVVFFILNRRIDRPDFEGYIYTASEAINKVTYSDNKFTQVTYDCKEKLELGEVFAEGVYTGLTNSVSRNVVHGLFDGHGFKVCECALFTGAGRQRRTAFVGKYINFINTLNFEGHIVINATSKEKVDQPTALEEIEALDGADDFIIYGPKDFDLKAVLGTKFISKVKALKVEGHLLNMIISIWAGHTSVFLSYDDLVNELPVEKPFNPEGVKQFQKDLPVMMEALAEIAK